ncbi:retrotransposon gag protein domain-containing protein [Pochonia chlamydosporia 170]|uniref:Retrotransposon gag protein domain-containing protein n=1 Tax=Pochonia chlamydosporia 170 TaxID=1380566 RepID=A0A179EWC7_METCM|nr:retrotransposon gag protein domain-containing protein [Pochonia chlamydosporia 170]OAQ57219.1 retrotransposon gag protein domain-containing protein [Pochonia chlamydosporia 170]
METNSQEGGSPSRTSQLLMQMITQLSEQAAATQQAFQRTIETLQTERQSDRAERNNDREEMRAQIRALQSAIATPLEDIANPAPQRANSIPPVLNITSPPNIISYEQAQDSIIARQKPSLPNPPKFDGTRKNFRPWYLEMRAKLIADRLTFRNEQEVFSYIYARLEGTAQNMSAAYFEQGGPDGSQSPDCFLDYLNRRYGDPNAKRRALDRLRALRQRPEESFATFFPKFEKELADSGGGSWEDAVQINYLEGALNYTLRDRLISVTVIPTTFNEYAELLLTISSRLDSRDYLPQNRHQKLTGPQKGAVLPPKQSRESACGEDTDQMDWETTKASRALSKKSPRRDTDRRLLNKHP